MGDLMCDSFLMFAGFLTIGLLLGEVARGLHFSALKLVTKLATFIEGRTT